MLLKFKPFVITLLAALLGIILYNIYNGWDQSQGQPPTLQLVDTNQLTLMMVKNDDLTIVDLREPELFEESRIPGAINIPFTDIQARYKELSKSRKIVFVCHTGRMGKESGNLLLQNGYMRVYNLDGGIAKWSGKLARSQ
ncbi:rhodanese-like domain-containing protein [Paenibacillus chondroitinus]|uniref:Rhodanese-like domain-containing protein n=1 Tax=Paenibacillus chondroitinus TaxID=59842 RepID=A0ABU6DHU2_9BACL|nr:MULTISPECIES: rhodanese-like domain-containing protein [Paenibacillus]MCY9659487.1 rhodanese-like domain-containing protein [Paenibacillus anseongense]MEB4796882.1 rhodanese-like domain-containing protein [Paenibacillus chondroitinus]